ncbi:MAG TPA: c-type cytochrome biogenesis protein CcmI [Pyrinomonadaceae bacterium]|nr:c-type cytochrome biogenesis protein CcmI [Pyrinomonadaceae bacterium]
MLTFWIIAALMILLALWFILPALLQKPNEAEEVQRREANVFVYRDQNRELEADLKNSLIGEDQYKAEKAELDRRLLEDVTAPEDSAAPPKPSNTFAYSVALFIPVGAIVFYLIVGNPKGLNPATAPATIPNAGTEQPGPMTQGQMSQEQVAANVDKLAARLKQNPNDPQGWTMLARSYMMQERFSDAASAYEKLTALTANDADAWADYAAALALASGQNLAGKPTEAINHALQINPKHQKALDLSGSAAYQAGDYKRAIEQWQKLLKLLPPGSDELKTVTEQISRTKELAASKK